MAEVRQAAQWWRSSSVCTRSWVPSLAWRIKEEVGSSVVLHSEDSIHSSLNIWEMIYYSQPKKTQRTQNMAQRNEYILFSSERCSYRKIRDSKYMYMLKAKMLPMSSGI